MTGQQLRLHLFSSTKELFNFSLPIVFGQLGLMLIALADVYVASQHSTLSAASLGVALGFINPIFLLGPGLLMGISPVLAIKRGRGEEPAHYFFSNLIYALAVSLFVMLLMFGVYLLIPYVGVEKKLIPFINKYILITVWSFPFACLFQAIKEYLQAFEKVILANIVAMSGVFINLFLNFGLVFGKWGLPQMGYDGLAYASLGVRLLTALFMLFFTLPLIKNFQIHLSYIKQVARFSIPIAAMIFLEVLGFCAVSILVGTIGIIDSAANSIVLNLASLTFMIPLSISSAATVKVGIQYGKKSFVGVLRFCLSALLLSEFFMCLSCCIFMLFPEQLMQQMSTDPKVIFIGVQLLFIVGIFQLVDGMQVTLAGILRGMEKTKESFYAIVLGYWVIGLPLGAFLAFSYELKAQGLWIGIAFALTIVMLTLGVITKKQLNIMKMALKPL